MTAAIEPTSPSIEKLLAEADKILKMAEDLKNRGHVAEAVEFALRANMRLRAVRALQELARARGV